MSEHSTDDPVGGSADGGSAGDHLADDTLESEETGSRYRPDGALASTPEDELLLEEEEEEP